MTPYRSSKAAWQRIRQNAALMTAGGTWSEQLPKDIRDNLRWFFFDGFFASAGDAITVTYIPLFILALGATSTQICLMASLASLSATLLLLPGAILADRLGKRKLIVLLGGGGITRLTLPLLALTPLLFAGPSAVYIAIALKVTADAFANLSLPAWTSMTGDVVPLAWRGRYFSARNIMMGISNMVSILLVGQLITHTHAPVGYQLALMVAFIVGSVSTYSYARIREPNKPAIPQDLRSYSPAGLLASLRADSNFATFCLYNAFWNFSMNLAGPFFTIYLVQDLHATAAMVGVTSLVASLTGLPAQRWFGQLSDRWGPRRVQLLTGLLIPILPISWVFTTNVWHTIPIQIGSGILCGGFNLASFNFLLALTPPEHRARFTALNQIAIAFASAIGAAIGGVIAGQFGYHAVFILSGIGRFLAMLVFIRFVRQPQPAVAMVKQEI